MYVESTIVATTIFVTEAMHFAMVAAVRAGPPDLGQYLREILNLISNFEIN